jgi:hypothetical protein
MKVVKSTGVDRGRQGEEGGGQISMQTGKVEASSILMWGVGCMPT